MTTATNVHPLKPSARQTNKKPRRSSGAKVEETSISNAIPARKCGQRTAARSFCSSLYLTDLPISRRIYARAQTPAGPAGRRNPMFGALSTGKTGAGLRPRATRSIKMPPASTFARCGHVAA